MTTSQLGRAPGGLGPTPPGSRLRWVLTLVTVVVLVLGGMGALGYFAATSTGRAGAPAAVGATARDLGVAPQYTLTDQSGNPVNSRVFAGQVQVVSFLFPYCTSYCPLIGRTLARLQADLPSAHLEGRARLVSFNVDPTGAGPAQLAAFMREFGGDPGNPDWLFLTGSGSAVDQVVRAGYHVYYSRISLATENAEIARQKAAGTYVPQPAAGNPLAARAKVNYDIVHNDYVEIVGPDGRIRQIFDNGSAVSEPQLLAAIRAALGVKAAPGG